MNTQAAPLGPRELLAAEFVLGLADGEDLLRARAMLARDPAFADEVARWEEHFAPLLDELGAAEPPPETWQRIAAATVDAHGAADSGGAAPVSAEIVSLKASRDRWRLVGGASAAAAAALAIMVVIGPTAGPVNPIDPPAPAYNEAPILAGSVPLGDNGPRLEITYLPERGEIMIAAPGLSADGIHDHELWHVFPDGRTDSLGLVVPGETTRIPLPMVVSQRLESGSPLILTREPIGGKPQGVDAGPVVADGQLLAVARYQDL